GAAAELRSLAGGTAAGGAVGATEGEAAATGAAAGGAARVVAEESRLGERFDVERPARLPGISDFKGPTTLAGTSPKYSDAAPAPTSTTRIKRNPRRGDARRGRGMLRCDGRGVGGASMSPRSSRRITCDARRLI